MRFEANSQSIFRIKQADLQVVYVKILLLFTPRIHCGSTSALIMSLITSLGSTEIHSAIIWPIADYSLSSSEKVRSCVYFFFKFNYHLFSDVFRSDYGCADEKSRNKRSVNQGLEGEKCL